MTFGELLERGIATIRLSESPRADALLLLARVAGRNRAWLVAHDDAEATAAQDEEFARLCQRRSSGAPVAYLLGMAGFYGREFAVDERVLVPRPETEHLVDEALRFIRGPMRVLDVGTGCGAIACTIAAESDASVDATDVSADALEVASANARRLGVAGRCAFFCGDLTAPVGNRRYDAVVANLPYVPTPDLPRPPAPESFEPRIALDGGDDGLRLYRRLLAEMPPLLERRTLLLFEAAPPIVATLAEITRAALPRAAVSVVSDYAGLERYVKASLEHGG